MEIIIGIAVLLVLLFFISGDIGTVIIAAAGIVALFMFVFFGFFVYFSCRVIRSEKRIARFIRIEKTEKMKFETAVYEIDGAEYPAAFPAEPIFRRRIYREGVPVKVRFSGKHGTVYDRNTIITVIAGTAVFAAAAAVTAFVIIGIF